MILKIIGAGVVLLGLAMLIFAGMAYFELHGAATSENASTADSMPLTKIVGPEFFAPGNSGTKPAELARKTFNRIYIIAGGGTISAILGVLIIAVPQGRRKNNGAS